MKAWPLRLLVALQLGDILSTRAALAQGIAEEGNPLMAAAIASAGAWPALVIAKLAFTAFAVLAWHLGKLSHGLGRRTVIAGAGVYIAVLANNLATLAGL